MLDAAVAVFAHRGFHAASMDEIAERAGISKPMVYAYLGAKESLFIACLHREATRLMQAVVDVVQPNAPPDQQLWNGLRGFFQFVGAHREGWAVLYRQARGQEPFATELRGMRARMVEVVAELLRDAVGSSVGEAELSEMAYALVGAGESVADWLVDNPHHDPEATATLLMNLVWLGAKQLIGGADWRPAGGGARPDASR